MEEDDMVMRVDNSLGTERRTDEEGKGCKPEVLKGGAKRSLTLNISILLGCQDPGGLLTGFDYPGRPDRPDRLLAGSWQDFDFPDRPNCPDRLLAGSLISWIVLSGP